MVTIAKAVSPEMVDVDSARYATICSLAGTFFDQYLKQPDELQPETITTHEYIQQLLAERPASFDTVYPHK
jgi:hypothetical protein